MPATDYTHSHPAPTRSYPAGAVSTSLGQGGGSTTTYYYVESNGTRGSVTDPDDIPAGATLRRVVTT